MSSNKFDSRNRMRRHRRIRRKIEGLKDRPRLNVFRSSRHIYVQIINDELGETIASASSLNNTQENKIKIASNVGTMIADKAKQLGVSEVVFDRGGYKYHGRVKALAEAARVGGLKF